MYMMGISENAISLITGSRVRTWGISALASSTASLTFCLAKSVLTSVRNSTIITDTSCKEVLLNFLIPEIDFNRFSMGLVIVFSMLVGELPPLMVLMYIVGTVMSGKFSLGKELYAIIPAMVIKMVIK